MTTCAAGKRAAPPTALLRGDIGALYHCQRRAAVAAVATRLRRHAWHTVTLRFLLTRTLVIFAYAAQRTHTPLPAVYSRARTAHAVLFSRSYQTPQTRGCNHCGTTQPAPRRRCRRIRTGWTRWLRDARVARAYLLPTRHRAFHSLPHPHCPSAHCQTCCLGFYLPIVVLLPSPHPTPRLPPPPHALHTAPHHAVAADSGWTGVQALPLDACLWATPPAPHTRMAPPPPHTCLPAPYPGGWNASVPDGGCQCCSSVRTPCRATTLFCYSVMPPS